MVWRPVSHASASKSGVGNQGSLTDCVEKGVITKQPVSKK